MHCVTFYAPARSGVLARNIHSARKKGLQERKLLARATKRFVIVESDVDISYIRNT